MSKEKISTKKCSGCLLILPTTAFSKHIRMRDGLQPRCLECNKIERAVRYRNDPNIVEDTHKRVKNKRKELAGLVDGYLATHPCINCGEKDIVVLEFDHVRGIKEFNISWAVFRQVSIKRMLDEIAKCDVRCANCHRRKTAKSGGGGRCISVKQESRTLALGYLVLVAY